MVGKVPSYKGFSPASPVSSKAKRNNKRRDTVPELLLRRELWKMGCRFRKNVETLPGKPDIAFLATKVAVFCDGDFWHGREWPALSTKLGQGTNAPYWVAKIAANRERDARNTALLEQAGWHVIRLWETDLKKDPLAAARAVDAIVRARRGSSSRQEPRETVS